MRLKDILNLKSINEGLILGLIHYADYSYKKCILGNITYDIIPENLYDNIIDLKDWQINFSKSMTFAGQKLYLVPEKNPNTIKTTSRDSSRTYDHCGHPIYRSGCGSSSSSSYGCGSSSSSSYGCGSSSSSSYGCGSSSSSSC